MASITHKKVMGIPLLLILAVLAWFGYKKFG